MIYLKENAVPNLYLLRLVLTSYKLMALCNRLYNVHKLLSILMPASQWLKICLADSIILKIIHNLKQFILMNKLTEERWTSTIVFKQKNAQNLLITFQKASFHCVLVQGKSWFSRFAQKSLPRYNIDHWVRYKFFLCLFCLPGIGPITILCNWCICKASFTLVASQVASTS